MTCKRYAVLGIGGLEMKNDNPLIKNDNPLIKVDSEKIKKYAKPMWWVIIIILVAWIGALLLGSFILNWVEQITNDESYNFGLVFAFVGASLIIAVPATVIIVNATNKTVAEVNYHFQRVADGDFTTKAEVKSKNAYVVDLVSSFNKMVDQLNSVAIMKNDFISTFSHEFKTPMVSIKGYAELLQGAENLTEEQQEYVKIIISESKRLSNLAEKVLMLSKIDSQVIIPNKTEFLVNGQLEECILLLDGVLQEKNIELSSNLKRVKINADAELIEEIWINVLGNAVKYTGENGKIEVACCKKGKNAVITIKDNGVGMSEETLSKAFEKFYQADGQHSNDGIGLGLTLCKKIAETFGGSIEVESELNVGTTVTITLPQNLDK